MTFVRSIAVSATPSEAGVPVSLTSRAAGGIDSTVS
jgi:hypothetical protein